mmetsp:Transcript_2587/g.4769  ORF Transcript_2587/g.4769 Transcript_2587/m.4769 type:complete len:241 (-) Transcript_2587:514-1236(-)|eukprot:CAMPEP_0197516516 /NCGR_PEP_ID=MMETSP1318-20131121/1407_1 /TAXON_ID=552666 /ORGANISM="Partenskyella glossopodia, Strain RCC365" /LENGTH=240 /DNA_ID=CAMNT_0043065323 /DNA_START=92 /DNA_END=814 /DNA_ORIENTATION=+
MSRIEYLCVGNLEGTIVASSFYGADKKTEKKYSNFCSRICSKGSKFKAGEVNILQQKKKAGSPDPDQFLVKLSKNGTKSALFICVSKNESMNKKAVLKDFEKEFWKTVEKDPAGAKTGSLNKASKPVFATIMSKHGRDRIAETNAKVAGLKNQMNQNIEQQLNNMEALVETEDKASELESDAKEFNKTSLSLKWAMCWKNAKWTIILVTTIVVILVVIIVVAVCFMNPDACKSDKKDENK